MKDSSFELKKLSKDSIPNALSKAKRYRLLNEPWQAESICRDILNVDPDNRLAILTLILAISDQFSSSGITNYTKAKELCEQLEEPYEKFYYRGILEERSGNATLKRNGPRIKFIAYDQYHSAMDFYAKAEAVHPEDDENSVLRWNACVRAIKEHKLEPATNRGHHQPFME